MILSIDPGVHDFAYALWDGNALFRASMATRGRDGLDSAIEEVAIEIPQIYHQSKLKGDPNDLIDLSIHIGEILSRFPGCEITRYWPRQWKGQVPKAVTKQRVEDRLTDDEKARIEWPKARFHHNVYDAIGIGLYHLGRTGRRHG